MEKIISDVRFTRKKIPTKNKALTDVLETYILTDKTLEKADKIEVVKLINKIEQLEQLGQYLDGVGYE